MAHVKIVLIAVLLAVAPTPQAFADVVTDWNAAALAAIRVARTSPPVASRILAILHVSIYDAVNGISRTHETYFVPSRVRGSASPDAAAAAAAHRVLVTFFPDSAADFDALLAATLGATKDGPQQSSGVAWGQFVADQILDARANDGAESVVPAPPGGAPGAWVPTPPAFAPYLLPQWGMVAPFGMASSDQFRPGGPPPLDSRTWAANYNEVRALGVAVRSSRTAEQATIAQFWADGAGTETPPGHWNHIAQEVVAASGIRLDDSARLFALLNIAMADAAISAWDAKYTYNFWRPVTAIRFGDTDGNPATAPDPSWSSFIATPPFPDYVSGHSTFSAAAATVLALFYGTDDIGFTTGTDAMPGVFRSFPSFSAAAVEAAMSRIYGGIHFRFASQDGLTAGSQIGAWTYSNYLQEKKHRSRR
jgi:membrane-associated phospholipid phosphatase